MAFRPAHTDYTLSPHTGLTRESWIEAARYMLDGIFRHIDGIDSPVIVPRQETVITYPHASSSGEAAKAEKKAEIFEGLTRSFFMAAPLIHIDPDISIRGHVLRDYYRHQILRTCTSGDEYCAGTYEELMKITGSSDPFRPFQQTVETCALVICLRICREEIWQTYNQSEKDTIAGFLSGFAHASTVPQNWRLFNMLDLAFLHNEGYTIDKDIMIDHAQAILEYYAGDGWYRDGQCFDYYSCWAFNFYAPIWNKWYGYENEPYIAAKFEENSNKLMESYADFFDRDGFTNMWGRSNIYRFASVSPFYANMLLSSSSADPGLARRISSGSLLQFLTREDFLWHGIPSMGFYKQFDPLIQGYSCAESPFWMGKAFLCLNLPPDHPFWTAKENNGTWETLGDNDVKQTILNGPALCFTNHGSNGETILRTGKTVKHQNDFHGMWNYSKLSYNTKYPWESTPRINDNALPFETGDVEAQQYVLKDITGGYRSLCNITYWGGTKDAILYRKQYFDYRTDVETHWRQGIYLADFPVSHGIMRADKLKLYRRPVILTLGSYGFPDTGAGIDAGNRLRCHESSFQIGKNTLNTLNTLTAKAIVLSGRDKTGRPSQMAMTIYTGFSDIGCISSCGTNPVSDNSFVIYASAKLNRQYDGAEPYVFISQVITSQSGAPFKDDEIFPIKSIHFTDGNMCGTYGEIYIEMKNGENRLIDYNEIEGRLSL